MPNPPEDTPQAVMSLSFKHISFARQQLKYFIGISEATCGSRGLSMHLVEIPPGSTSTPHIHNGYETAIYVLEGCVETRYGSELENSVISHAGDFLFIPPEMPHQAFNLSTSNPARAIIARNSPVEQENVIPYNSANPLAVT